MRTDLIPSRLTPDGVSLLVSRPRMGWLDRDLNDGRQSKFKAGETIAVRTQRGLVTAVTIHGSRRGSSEWWAVTPCDDGDVQWWTVRRRPTCMADFRRASNAGQVYRRDALGRFA